MQAVEDETDWDRKGYDWQTGSAHRVKEGDDMLLLDFAVRSASLVRIVDTTEISTPDGRYS